MIINEYKLNYESYPPMRKTSLKDKMTRRIYVCSENVTTFDIGLKHKEYQDNGMNGLPYHYVIKNSQGQDGNIYYCLPTVYQNGLKNGSGVQNCIAICVMGNASTLITNAQKTSLISLCSFLVEQEGLVPEDVLQLFDVGGKAAMPDSDWIIVKDAIKTNIASVNLYKCFTEKNVVLGVDELSQAVYKLTITNDFKNLNIIANIIGCPVSTLQTLNTIPLTGQTITNIKPGTVIYLPITGITIALSVAAQQGVAATSIAASISSKVSVVSLQNAAYAASASNVLATDIYEVTPQTTAYGGKRFQRWQQEPIEFPGYQNATLQITDNNKNKVIYLPFLISPSSFGDNRSTTQQISKTNAGWFVMRTGSNPTQVNLNGFMLDIKSNLERHEFLLNYKRYIEDTRNENFEYVNDYSIKLLVEGREYSGFVQSINFQKTGMQPFTYQYSIGFVALSDHQDYNSSDALQSREEIMSSIKTTTVASKIVGDTLFNYMSKTQEETDLYGGE